MLFARVVIGFFTSANHSGVVLGGLCGKLLLDFNCCKGSLYHDERGDCGKHVHVIHGSQNHHLLTVGSLSLEHTSWWHQDWWWLVWNIWHLVKDKLTREWGGIEEGQPRLVFISWLENNHWSLISWIVRSVVLSRDISALHMTIWGLDFILHSDLSWVEVVLLSWSEIACMLIVSIVHRKNTHLDTRTIDEIHTKWNFLWWHLTYKFSNFMELRRSSALLSSWLLFSRHWLDSILFTRWCATHYKVFLI